MFGEDSNIIAETDMELISKREEISEISKPNTIKYLVRLKKKGITNKIIKKSENINDEKTIYINIEADVDNFKTTNIMVPLLQRICSTYMSVRPDTVEVERMFSVSGILLRKEMTRTGEDLVDGIIFLRYYFKDTEL